MDGMTDAERGAMRAQQETEWGIIINQLGITMLSGHFQIFHWRILASFFGFVSTSETIQKMLSRYASEAIMCSVFVCNTIDSNRIFPIIWNYISINYRLNIFDLGWFRYVKCVDGEKFKSNRSVREKEKKNENIEQSNKYLWKKTWINFQNYSDWLNGCYSTLKHGQGGTV